MLKNDATLSDYTKSKLIELLQSNVNFTVATARSLVSLQAVLRGLPIKLPVIEFNGAFISDFNTGSHKIINAIGASIVFELLSLIRKYGFFPFISSFDGKRDSLHYKKIENEGMEWYLRDRIKANDRRLKKSGSLRETLKEDIVCFTVIDKPERLIDLTLEINDNYADELEIQFMNNQYSPGWHWLTIYDRRAAKDRAIVALLAELGLATENLTVFGDHLNDRKMFKIAANAIAVENAQGELKEYATEIIGPNEEDSVVKYIINDSAR